MKSNDMERESGETDFNPSDISDKEKDEGPAVKVRKGMEDENPGREPAVYGSIVGSGSGGEAVARNTLGHGERCATVSGSTMGQKV